MVDKTDYEVDLNDKRLTDVTDKGDKAVSDLEKTYSGMVNQSDAFYQKQIAEAENWGAQQEKAQRDRTDFTIQQIEQQKAQAKKDYTKEQSASYVDWQKQSNEYGANAEAMAAQGMANTGYSESSQVSMYNTYQNRVVAARDSYDRAVLNYNNSIKEAQLANDAALAEIAYNTLQKTLELSLQGFQYKNQLVSELTEKKLQTQSYWQSVYKDVLDQLNTEANRAFAVDSFNEEQAIRQAQLEIQQAQEKREQEKWERQQEQLRIDAARKAAANSRPVGQGSAKTIKTKLTNDEKKLHGNTSKTKESTVSAVEYLNKLIASGASKDKVSNEISLALRNGAITTKEAQKLRSTFTPRGLQY